jgi:radical SAM/Cys-rich protein
LPKEFLCKIMKENLNVHSFPDFCLTLKEYQLKLLRDRTATCQVNLGFLCNQVCKHCHLVAGPDRTEIMDLETIREVVAFQDRCRFEVVDITGGAPEMNPHLVFLIEKVTPMTQKLILRSNLSEVFDNQDPELLAALIKNRVTIVSSLPSLNNIQTDSQRGKGVFEKTIDTLIMLNKKGYGKKDTGLELDLVSNPSGVFMPSSQDLTEKRYRDILLKKYGIVFNNLFTFANMPLGRFETWLKTSKNYTGYMEKLCTAFNPCTVEGLMCKSLISVSWDGTLFDCDFNLAANLYMGNRKTHISQIKEPIFKGQEITVGNHCYACTAGSGFT